MTQVLPDQVVITSGNASVSENVDAVPWQKWGAKEIASYVNARIAEFHGPQPRCRNEREIFEGFFSRFGPDAVRIARAAFDVHGGMWMGAPVSVARFGPSSDDCFARRLLPALAG